MLFVGIIVSESCFRNLLNAWNQTVTVIVTVNCTVGHAPYAFNVYCVNKTTSSVLPAEYRQKNSACVTAVSHK
jgi:hypothetical protein